MLTINEKPEVFRKDFTCTLPYKYNSPIFTVKIRYPKAAIEFSSKNHELYYSLSHKTVLYIHHIIFRNVLFCRFRKVKAITGAHEHNRKLNKLNSIETKTYKEKLIHSTCNRRIHQTSFIST